jgi:hypothetical protein
MVVPLSRFADPFRLPRSGDNVEAVTIVLLLVFVNVRFVSGIRHVRECSASVKVLLERNANFFSAYVRVVWMETGPLPSRVPGKGLLVWL